MAARNDPFAAPAAHGASVATGTNDYGAHHQYGHLLKVAYSGAAGVASYSFNDYQNNLANNPCPR